MSKSKSLADLGDLFQQAETFSEDSLSVLSNPNASSKEKQQARKELERAVNHSLQRLEDTFNAGKDSFKVDYKDYLRKFASYLLAFGPSGNYYGEAFLNIISILIDTASFTFRHELREMRRSFNDNRSRVVSLGFDWDDLSGTLDPNNFAPRFLAGVVTVEPEEKVVYKEVVKETVKEVEKVVEKIVVVKEPVETQEDSTFFGNEDHNTELKSSFVDSYNDETQPYNVCKAICAFLNADGGMVYIGVNDNGHALPMGCDMGVEHDIKSLGNRLPFGKSTVDAYCIYVKHRIEYEFDEGNDVSKFNNNIIVSQTENENVIKIEVRPSMYCVPRLRGEAFARSGAECRKMTDDQIQRRMQDLMSVSMEVRFRNILSKAIEARKQVILYSYNSTSSGISDRYVEPVNFVRDNIAVSCYDTTKECMRQFKLSRIGDVKVLDRDWEHEDRHEKMEVDLFGWPKDDESYEICLNVHHSVRTFLLEQHPNMKKSDFVNLGNGLYSFDTEVNSLEPLRGIFLNFADKIEICESKDSEALKERIREYVRNNVLAKIGMGGLQNSEY